MFGRGQSRILTKSLFSNFCWILFYIFCLLFNFIPRELAWYTSESIIPPMSSLCRTLAKYLIPYHIFFRNWSRVWKTKLYFLRAYIYTYLYNIRCNCDTKYSNQKTTRSNQECRNHFNELQKIVLGKRPSKKSTV